MIQNFFILIKQAVLCDIELKIFILTISQNFMALDTFCHCCQKCSYCNSRRIVDANCPEVKISNTSEKFYHIMYNTKIRKNKYLKILAIIGNIYEHAL